MSRKVFISVLGTGVYKNCVYENENFKAHDTRFIQVATLEMLTADGTWNPDVDAAYILLTPKARSANWQVENNERINPKVEKTADKTTKEKEAYIGLKDELESKSFPVQLNEVDIPDGMNEQEIWEVFDKTYQLLQDGDEVYFDITHAFRYLPMLILVLCNYAKFLRGIKVKAITYGNYEARDNSNPPVAPIMDLTSFSALQDWTNAASDYLRHGDARALKECSMLGLNPILKQAKGSDAEATNLKKLVDKLSKFSEYISFCRGMKLYQSEDAKAIEQHVENVSGAYLKPFLPLLITIKNTVDGYSANEVNNILRSARLSLQYGNYQACVTLLMEGMITFFCQRHGISVDDEKKRECVNKAVTKKQLTLKGELGKYKPLDEEMEKLVDVISQDELLTKVFVDDYSNLTNVRNDMNHAGMRSNTVPMHVNKMCSNIEKCVKVFSEVCKVENARQEQQPKQHLFINFSNHPFSSWSEEQLAAARAYGKIEDMTFPSVPPRAKEDEIDGMAKERVSRILEKTADADVTVHVMGEMSLTFRIVQLLKSHGIRCVCSTTQRMVAEQDGRKVTEFHFEQFREY